MSALLGVSQFRTDGVTVRWTSRSTGSFALDQPDLSSRYRVLADGHDVVYPRQEHGTVILDAVTTAADSAAAGSLVAADAVVSVPGGPAIAVITADCAPVAIWTSDGVIGVAHAGWRGLVAGVIEATVAAVQSRSSDPQSIQAVLGPCIGPCCYEFGEVELAMVEAVYGGAARARTNDGQLALDMRAGVRLALERSGATFTGYLGEPDAPTDHACTSCGSDWFSWRRHREVGRQALVVYSQPLPERASTPDPSDPLGPVVKP